MDVLTREQRSYCMSRIRAKNTKPEVIVRQVSHRLGYRFRLHRSDLAGKPDLAFISRRKVIFVHGCFWHQHKGCKLASTPKSSADYWLPKLERNVARDNDSTRQLANLGWESLVIWECETKDTDALASRLERFLG